MSPRVRGTVTTARAWGGERFLRPRRTTLDSADVEPANEIPCSVTRRGRRHVDDLGEVPSRPDGDVPELIHRELSTLHCIVIDLGHIRRRRLLEPEPGVVLVCLEDDQCGQLIEDAMFHGQCRELVHISRPSCTNGSEALFDMSPKPGPLKFRIVAL